MKHRCGGELKPQKIRIKKKVGLYYQYFTVDGFICDYCGEETISRNTAFDIDAAIKQLRDVWKNWRIPSDTKATAPSINEQIYEVNNYVKI